MELDFVINRLKAPSPVALTGMRQVGTCADAESALTGTVSVPAAFVLPVSELGAPSQVTQVTRQRITCRFGVLLCVANRRDNRGDAALGDLASVRAQLRQALVGWAPDPATGEPVQFARGRFFRMEAGRVWWLDEFDFVTFYRSN